MSANNTLSLSSSDENTPRTFQTVFRVSLPGQKQNAFHSRRAHKKSRAGCLTCKKRRVKCDEEKPKCQRCKNRGIECCYSSDLESTSNDERKGMFSPTTIISSFAMENITKSIQTTLSLDQDQDWSPFVLLDNNSDHPISTIAFQHFVRCSTDTIAVPAIRDVMRTDMIRVAFTSDHLMYTILAVAMLHYNRYSPNKGRSLVESYFWQAAIESYQKALSSQIRPENVNALLSTCMLMGVMTICPEKFEPTDSWVLTNRPEAMNWLALQSGLKTILKLASPYLSTSIWGDAFKEVDKTGDKIFKQEAKGREGLDSDLADLCGIDDESTERNNVYYAPLVYLSQLMKLEHNGPNAAHCASFMGRLECDFLALLRRRDPPALIILAYWMGLMCLLSEWQPWIEGRIRNECVAICMFLEYSTDSRILLLLRFPAAASGYKSYL
ncbi:hypothetical protein N7520_010487 [Penicillium odoratum]|uniref:uncharacterized protein n=1 Tax=Penicillium odoratum TaxID=1167516 RepID=UPI002547B603|nr:uncharacterized protein N7520_010487 [Penicillium odoratum]KAJ5745305.1 hypothetical protein N7520_010487 [Penicillium odoratum]